eukprot:CAMPEP_0201725218 /NCGR_PEP_ID=MMETSP0593-20130828/8685_1 /ASSEMBLY_ACC=CAM_ASM_000672 /TAXON_ID=267983 /ORGANISM="Skeletonema japonicum, Strain CCMP2506" /LENGTH=198 /DNA_ID=CAMNT_0048216561 /DNA_START=313 /DNA_END=906 /DNA_ORIENTATION=-
MPKLHNVSKSFLKKQGYKECLVNGQRIQGKEEGEVKVKNATTSLAKSNNQPSGGESLLNGTKKEKSKINNNRETGMKRRRPDVESSSAVEWNQNSGTTDHSRGSKNTTTTTSSAAPAAAAASVNLKRRNQHIIWVHIGTTDHPAYELYNPDNPGNDSSTVWVEYVSNGAKECVHRNQIKTGLQDRKRHRPNYDETGRW